MNLGEKVLSKKDMEDLISEALDPKKVVLTCGQHHYVYGRRTKPNFKCKRCMFTMFFGLIANTPPDKRQDQLEMLEYSVHQLLEAKNRGELQDFFKHPEVYLNSKRIGVPTMVN
jgi:hypothetical protein